MTQRAVLLANLGSPDKPETAEVRRYLNQFLMDPYVIQLPWPLRRMIVSLFVLPTRPKASAEAYQSVWWPEGSPLVVLSQQLRDAVQAKTDVPVAMAMRYGQPSIEQELLKLCENPAITEVLFMPMYPHFADSTVETSVQEAKRVIKAHNLTITLRVIQPFYDDANYISALVESASAYLNQPHDHLIFSYHGLPESHILKRDESGRHCLKQAECCATPHPAHAHCYRHQVMRTTAAFAAKAGLDPSSYSVAFQSRLGRQKWLGPNTEDRIRELAASGARKLLVICPAFVTDCLETLEEIQIRGQEVFEEAGGEQLTLIPCLNTHPAWVDLLSQWCETETSDA